MEVLSQCFECSQRLERGVILYCPCEIAFCVECAVIQISNSNETYESKISCPSCGGSPSVGAHSENGQIERRSIDEAAKREYDNLKSAFEDLLFKVYDNVRKKEKVATFHPLIKKLRERGFLLESSQDIDILEMDDSKIKIVRLLTARAEEQRQSNLKNSTSKMEKMSTGKLPLGPLALLEIKINKSLDDFLNKKPFDNKCQMVDCDTIIQKGETVFMGCGCHTKYCQICTKNFIGCKYMDEELSSNCLFNHKHSLILSGIEEACKEEKRLVDKALERFGHKSLEIKDKKDSEIILDSLRRLRQSLVKEFEDKAKAHKVSVGNEGKDTQLDLSVKELMNDISRRQARFELMENAQSDKAEIEIMSDHLPLGHLAELRLMSDPILEVLCRFNTASERPKEIGKKSRAMYNMADFLSREPSLKVKNIAKKKILFFGYDNFILAPILLIVFVFIFCSFWRCNCRR